MATLTIKQATQDDIPVILTFIKELADYEKLSHEVVATEEDLRQTLFGDNPHAEVVIGYLDKKPASFALFFHNYSTFLAKPGLYLEDLFVKPALRGHGIGQQMLTYLANLAKERGCGRFEWSVLDWNKSAILFYEKLGAKALDEWTSFRVTGKALDALASQYTK